MRKVLIQALAIVGVLSVLPSCGDSEKDHRGVVVLSDMAHTPAHKSQTAREIRPVGADGTSAGIPVHVPTGLPSPEHAVPRGESVVWLPKEAKDASGLINPLMPTADALLNGRHLYKAHCAACHGTDGISAHAPMAKHLAGVPQLGVLGLAALSDGEIFHIVSKGKARMPAMAERMTVDERWQMIHYVRVLARSNAVAVKADEFTEQVRAASYSSTSSATALIEQRERDAAIIKRGGGDRFIPWKSSPSAPMPPGWTDLTPAGGNAPAKAH